MRDSDPQGDGGLRGAFRTAAAESDSRVSATSRGAERAGGGRPDLDVPEIQVDADGTFVMPSDAAPFRDRVLAWISVVPSGRVATYGQIAALAGSPRAARQVGAVLRGLMPRAEAAPSGSSRPPIPWQRIVNARGGMSTDKLGFGDLQRALLEAEGIEFGDDGRLSLRRYRWDPGDVGGGAAAGPVDGADEAG